MASCPTTSTTRRSSATILHSRVAGTWRRRRMASSPPARLRSAPATFRTRGRPFPLEIRPFAGVAPGGGLPWGRTTPPNGGAKEGGAMARADVDGVQIEYELIGEGRPWVITPGGRFSKDTPGVRQLAEELAGHGNRVLIWDRPNTGASDVNFTGSSESQMQADVLAGLIRHLDLGPTIIVGGSGGSR